MARSRAEGAEGGGLKEARPRSLPPRDGAGRCSSRCGYIALLVVASVSPLLPDLMPRLLPDLWRGAPLAETEAPLRTEAVYGVAGVFDSEAESGSFFVPRVSFYDEEAEGASIFGRVMDCRWPWVAERVLESQLGYASGYEIAEVDGATLYLWNDRDGGSDLVCLDGTRVLDLNLSPAIDMETLCAALKNGRIAMTGAHYETIALAPDLWLRAPALEAWLNDRARQGWSLAGLEGTDALLRQDGGGRRFRVLAHADAGLAAFSRRCEAEGWQLAASGDGAHVFEAVREMPGALDERGSRAYARGRCGRRALCWPRWRRRWRWRSCCWGFGGTCRCGGGGALAALCFLPALPPLALCLALAAGAAGDAARGVGRAGRDAALVAGKRPFARGGVFCHAHRLHHAGRALIEMARKTTVCPKLGRRSFAVSRRFPTGRARRCCRWGRSRGGASALSFRRFCIQTTSRHWPFFQPASVSTPASAKPMAACRPVLAGLGNVMQLYAMRTPCRRSISSRRCIRARPMPAVEGGRQVDGHFHVPAVGGALPCTSGRRHNQRSLRPPRRRCRDRRRRCRGMRAANSSSAGGPSSKLAVPRV